jgi:glycosyltransferase involved in cell wall biosynthesis
MRIAIDARELAGKPTGVGRYLASLLETWGALPAAAAHEFVLCAPNTIAGNFGALRTSIITAAGTGTVWEQLTLPRLLRSADAGVLFAPAYTGPLLSSLPMVLAVHDVSFSAYPEWFPWREGLRRRVLTRRAAARAARVLTVSDFSKREIVRYLGTDPGKIDVIYHGATTMVDRPSSAGRDPLVLYVGSIFNRRHVPELVAGFATLARRRDAARLVLVGDNRSMPHVDLPALIAQARLGDRIIYRSYVPDEELAGLYARARAFVFLSDYEGFGLTPLEALASGVPVIVLDTEVAREIYGPAAIYLESPDPALVDAALERVLFDEQERERLIAAARTVVARYSWQECAHRTLQVLLASGQ